MAQFKIEFFKASSITPEKVEGGYFGDFESAERYADQRRHELGCRSYDVRELDLKAKQSA